MCNPPDLARETYACVRACLAIDQRDTIKNKTTVNYLPCAINTPQQASFVLVEQRKANDGHSRSKQSKADRHGTARVSRSKPTSGSQFAQKRDGSDDDQQTSSGQPNTEKQNRHVRSYARIALPFCTFSVSLLFRQECESVGLWPLLASTA